MGNRAQLVEMAIEQVIMDAIAKGHTDKNQLVAYMASTTFEKAVQSYLELFESIKAAVAA